MNHLRAVIFDWAGTTVDYGSRAPTQVFREVFRRNGIEISIAEARGPMGMAKRDHLAAILAVPRVNREWELRHFRMPQATDIDRLYAEFLPLQRAVLLEHCDVIPGIPEMVAACRRQELKIGSTTGYTRELMEVLKPLAQAGGFSPDVTVCADDVPHGRPAPWMLLRAAEHLNVYPASSLVAVDDTRVGIEAGRNAGAWTVAVTMTGNSLGLSREEVAALDPTDLKDKLKSADEAFRACGADYVIDTAANLLPILSEISARLGEAGK